MKLSTFLDEFLTWRIAYNTDDELAHADVILTHEFGNQHDVSVSTRAMADMAIELHREHGIPWVAQFPGNEVDTEIAFATISSHILKPGEYLDTEEVNRQFAEICRQNGWKATALITHPDHAWRAKKNLERYGFTVLVPNLDSIPYDPTCTRWVVKYACIFKSREVLARVLYFIKGYL